MSGGITSGLIVPGLPQPLLAPEQNPGWRRLREAFAAAGEALRVQRPDVLLIYSVMWPSIIGHQIQADPAPSWVHVDELFHDLGSIPYTFRVDADFAETLRGAAEARGLRARTVAYRGFPIDTGSIVALKLLTPNNEIPACIVSSNIYSDRAETVVLGKAAADAARASGKRVAAVAVTTLSNRLFTDFIDPADDRIHSPKDDEWNRKILELLGDGRLEDVAQLSREIHRQIRVHKVVNFKPMWWLSAAMGQHNHYTGRVFGYEALYGTGGAVVSLRPAAAGVGDKEYDEEDVEVYRGDRGVLPAGGAAAGEAAAGEAAAGEAAAGDGVLAFEHAPEPVGAYPHARRVGDLLYLSGIGPRQPGTGAIPGGPTRDGDGPRDYDIRAQTRAVIDNVRLILEAAGSSLERVVDVTAFLVDMDRDFAGYNEVYAEAFSTIQAARTTVAVRALPTPIAVELKVVATVG